MTLKKYKGKKVFVTGHTGFKGSWLCAWLMELGAEVTGYSLEPMELSHFNLLKLPMKSYIDDINNYENLFSAIKESRPDIIFHLAAQPLVRPSYDDPIYTYQTNVIGTLNVYQAALKNNVQSLVSITTDKVYKNNEWLWGYRENDQFGGHDPYSSSKACVEILTESFQKSFLYNNQMFLATARAGNVIGGGDWAQDRLIPDLVKNAAINKSTPVRNPQSVRPWQHVLEPLNGYLMLGEKLLNNESQFCTGFNFGPNSSDVQSVKEMCSIAKVSWNQIDATEIKETTHKHEAGLLRLDITKAQELLKWSPIWSSNKATEVTINWYREYYMNKKVETFNNLKEFLAIKK